MDEAAGSQSTDADRVAESTDQYLTKRRREILAKLERLGPELADVYRAALRLIGDESFPGRVRLIAHAVREITNRLPDYLDVPVKRGQVQYKNRLDSIAPTWQAEMNAQRSISGVLGQAQRIEPQGKATDTPTVTISVRLFRGIDDLVTAHVQSRSTLAQKLRGVMQSTDAVEAAGAVSELDPIVEHWKGLTKWFVKRVHIPGPGKTPTDFEECRHRFKVFESVLYALLCPFYGPVEELDAILEEANRPRG